MGELEGLDDTLVLHAAVMQLYQRFSDPDESDGREVLVIETLGEARRYALLVNYLQGRLLDFRGDVAMVVNRAAGEWEP